MKEEIPRKTVTINKTTWVILTNLKTKEDKKSMDELIYSLILKAKKISEEGK